MEGKKFSSSRGVQILVRDFLSRYDPDALRYFLSIAGPETQDTDFTWSEFVRRNNDELVATWGNLVNRTLQSAFKNFGARPRARTARAGGRRAPRRDRTRIRVRRLADRGCPLQGTPSKRRCGSPASATSTSPSRRRGRCSSRTPRGPATDPLRRASSDRQPQDPAYAVHSVLVAAAPRAPRLRRLDRRSARVSHRYGGRRPRARRAHRRLRELGRPLGRRARFRPGRRCASPRRSSPSSMRSRSSPTSLRGWRPLPPRDGHARALGRVRGARRARTSEPQAAGVARIVTIGTGIESSRATLAIADRHEGVFAALGVDPHQARAPDARRLDELTRAARSSEGRRGRGDRTRRLSRSLVPGRAAPHSSTRSSTSRTSSVSRS